MLQAFIKVQPDTFLFGSLRFVLKGVDRLIHHNINNESYDWLNVFTVARLIDPQYEFINKITFAKCNDRYIEYCFEKILRQNFDQNVQVKIFKVSFLLIKSFLFVFISSMLININYFSG